MKRFFSNLPIKHKLTALTVVISGVALLLACVAFAIFEQGVFRRTMARDFAILADMFDDNVAAGLAFKDRTSIEQTLKTLGANQHILAACVYDLHGAVIEGYRRGKAPLAAGFEFPAAQATGQRWSSERLDTFQDITLAGEIIGVVYIGVELTELRDRAWRYAVTVGVLLIGCSLVALLLVSRFQHLVSQPIVDLAQTVAAVTVGKNYSVRAHKESDDELGRLIDGFNEMLAQIQARDTALQDAQSGLEQRVALRTTELAQSLSLLNATLESTTDGIVVVDGSGRITSHNSKFAAMWRLTDDQIAQPVDDRMLALIAEQLKDGETFMAKVRELSNQPEAGSHDVLEMKDGRVFERDSQPQRLNSVPVGRVWSFRDVTERQRAEETMRESEERFSGAFELAPIGVALVSPEGGWLRVNRAICALVGYTEAELLSRTFQDITHPGDLAADLAQLHRLVAGEIRSYEMEKRYIHKQGHLVTVLLNVSLVRDGQGQPRYFIAQIQDISARKQTENALRESNEKFHQLADNITDAFWIRSPDLSEVHYLSPAFEKIWGRPVASLYANPQLWAELILPEDRERVQAAFAKLTGDSPSLEIEYRIVRPDGEIRWVRVRGFQVRDATAKLIRHIGIVTDITAWKKAEASLQKAHEELVGASRHAGMAEVATGVLHNVGNVLNSVNVSATLVTEQVRHTKAANIAKVAALFAEHQADLATFVTQNPRGLLVPTYLATLAEALATEQRTLIAELDHLRKNIDHIKDIVAMQQNFAKNSGMIETVALAELVEDALRMNASSLTRHDVAIVRDFQLRPVISTDKHKVVQILINLVRNAKHACDDAGRPDKRITLRIDGDAQWVRVSVSDNGIGIPADNLTRIFAHGFTTKKDGHGFGLHSGALAAKELGGSLSVQSAGPGHGATFSLDLPNKPAALHP